MELSNRYLTLVTGRASNRDERRSRNGSNGHYGLNISARHGTVDFKLAILTGSQELPSLPTRHAHQRHDSYMGHGRCNS